MFSSDFEPSSLVKHPVPNQVVSIQLVYYRRQSHSEIPNHGSLPCFASSLQKEVSWWPGEVFPKEVS